MSDSARRAHERAAAQDVDGPDAIRARLRALDLAGGGATATTVRPSAAWVGAARRGPGRAAMREASERLAAARMCRGDHVRRKIDPWATSMLIGEVVIAPNGRAMLTVSTSMQGGRILTADGETFVFTTRTRPVVLEPLHAPMAIEDPTPSDGPHPASRIVLERVIAFDPPKAWAKAARAEARRRRDARRSEWAAKAEERRAWAEMQARADRGIT